MTQMKAQPNRTRIGASELEIAPLALGGNVFGWTADRDDSFAVLDAFVAGGGDFIDTADSYSHWAPGNTGGDSERIIGEWIAARGSRDRVVIATKVAHPPDFMGLGGANIRAAADASLQRLGTDRIDLYYAHHDFPEVPIEEIAEAFSSLVDAGKVRAIGISNLAADRIVGWCEYARANGLHVPVALQPHYSLVEREFETNGLRDIAEAQQLAVFPYYALARGFLAGKYRTPADATAAGASPRAEGAAQYLDARGEAVLAALDLIANARQVEVATVALAWLRLQPTVAAPIASARNMAQLPAILASMTLDLTESEVAALTDASA